MGDDDDLFSSDEEIVEVKPVAKKVKGQGPQVMRWCVTYNNPTITAEAMNNHLIACDGVKGFVFQEETGAMGPSTSKCIWNSNYKCATLASKVSLVMIPYTANQLKLKRC